MKHQQSSYQTDRKAGKYLTQCMMSQNNPCGTQYTCNQDKQAQPCYGIITEQRTERDQSSDVIIFLYSFGISFLKCGR